MNSVAKVTFLACLAFGVAGCSTRGGARWYAPATWFSSSEAKASDRAEIARDERREAVIKAAQIAAHETREAVDAAPDSRAIEVARESASQAVSLLDQAAGPLTVAQIQQLRAQIAGLLSENAELRSAAEADRAESRAAAVKLSDRLRDATAAVTKAQTDLRSAFDRENALADQLRARNALAWIAGGVALVCAAAWVYLKVTLGGLPGAMAKGLTALRAKNLIPPSSEENVFDVFLDRSEQAAVARHLK